MSDQKPSSPEMQDIIAKAKDLFHSIKKGVNKLIVDVSAKLPKSSETPPKSDDTPPSPPMHQPPHENPSCEIKPPPVPPVPPAPPEPTVPPVEPSPTIHTEPKESDIKKPKKDNDAPE